MALSVFDDRQHRPSPRELTTALGDAAPLWTALVALVRARHAAVAEQWNFAGAKFGWSLRLVEKKKNLVYLTPGERQFLVGVVLGEKAIAAAHLAGAALAIVESAPRYAEGRGVRLEVATPSDLEVALQVVDAKLGGKP